MELQANGVRRGVGLSTSFQAPRGGTMTKLTELLARLRATLKI
jgi:hypothetical protein